MKYHVPGPIVEKCVCDPCNPCCCKKVKVQCPDVKWLAHYALLGRYDFMDIYEAPDAETAHRVSLISRADGALEAESWQALPYDKYLDLVGEIET